MDPNATLAIIRNNIDAIVWDTEADIVELAEAFEALDSWLNKGGHLPADWERP
jgi:hypothetical protein